MSAAGRQRPRRQGAEVFLDLREHVRGRHVADDRDHRVVRSVVVPEEGLHVLDVRGVEVLERAVPVVGVLPLVEGLVDEVGPEEEPIGPVLHVDPDLLLHDLLLVLQVLLGEVEVLHPVGFEPQDRVERGDGRRRDVVRVVVAGGSVEHAATALDDARERALGRHRRPFEHHVLEEVREAGAPLRLEAKADPERGRDPERRRRVVLGHDHGEPVGELLHGDGNAEAGRRRGGEHGRRQEPGQCQGNQTAHRTSSSYGVRHVQNAGRIGGRASHRFYAVRRPAAAGTCPWRARALRAPTARS